MSKTTFDPKAKAFVSGESPEKENPAEEQNSSKKLDSFEKISGLSWKALTAGSSTEMDAISDIAFASDGSLERAVSVGVVSGATILTTGPKNIFDFSVEKVEKDEWKDYFQPIELPPSLSDAIALYPDELDTNALQDSIDQTRSYIEDNLYLFEDRKSTIEGLIENGKITNASDIKRCRQFIDALEEAVKYTKTQLKDLSAYEEDKIGGGSSI